MKMEWVRKTNLHPSVFYLTPFTGCHKGLLVVKLRDILKRCLFKTLFDGPGNIHSGLCQVLRGLRLYCNMKKRCWKINHFYWSKLDKQDTVSAFINENFAWCPSSGSSQRGEAAANMLPSSRLWTVEGPTRTWGEHEHKGDLNLEPCEATALTAPMPL